MTPIPITFTRELPTKEGHFLWQLRSGHCPCVRHLGFSLGSPSMLYEYDENGSHWAKDIGGEWAGPETP